MLNKQTLSTREKVLEKIKREKEVTVKELTNELGITPMAIRGHLNKLERDDLIEVKTLRQKLGRPLQVFSLTSKGESVFPKQYSQFAIDLLSDIESIDGGKTLEKVIVTRESRIIEERRELLKIAINNEAKIKLYCDFLEQDGRMPNFEKINNNKFVLNINNCPFLEIAMNYHFCCDSDIRIIKEIFPEAKVEQVKNQVDKDKCCSYEFDF